MAELKGAGDLIPNQAILINAIPLQEAKASSEIENIVTTQDKLYRAAALEGADADLPTKEVLRYRSALRHGFEALAARAISTNLLIEVCSVLLGTEITLRKVPGTHLTNPITNDVIYTPPPPQGEGVIRDKLSNLERFIHDHQEIDPLVRLALIHYQFEAIHPFYDGNGRTGRILNILFLVSEKLLTIPVLYLSRYIIENKADYYNLLRGVTEQGAWEPWILYILDAIEVTAQETCQRISAIRNLD